MRAPDEATAMNRLAPVLAILLLAVIVFYLPLALFGYPAPGHDYAHHHAMLADFRAGLEEGVLYPRWAADPNWGLGAATFYYYPPLGYYAAALGQAITGDPDHGFHLIGAAAAALGALACFTLLRRDTRPRVALAGAVLYLLLPYSTYVLWHRFAWAEFCALAWMPLLFLAARDFAAAPRPRTWLLLTVGFAGIAASHLLTALVFCPLVAAYLVHAALRRRSGALLGLTALAGVTALALTAVFLLPVALERDLVHLEHVESGFHHYLRHFLFLDAAAVGYAPDPAKREVLPAACATLALLLGAGIALLATRRLRARAAFILAAGLGLYYLTTVAAEPVWRVFSLLSILQFPWRLLGPVGFLAVWLFGLALEASTGRGRDPRPNRNRARRIGPAAWAVVIPAVAAVAVAAINIVSAYSGDDPRAERGRKGRVVVVEYLPRAADYEALADYVPLIPAGARQVTTRGTTSAETLRWTPHHRILRLDVGPEGAEVVPLVFDFPGWRARLDGRPLAMVPVPRLGLAAVTIPPGTHTLELVNEPVASRTTGGWISLAGLLAALVLARSARGVVVGPARPILGPRRTAWLAGFIALVAIALPAVFPYPMPQPSAVVITVGGLTTGKMHEDRLAAPEALARNFPELARLPRFQSAAPPAGAPAEVAARLLGAPQQIAALRSHGYRVHALLARDLRADSEALAQAFPDAVVVKADLLGPHAGRWLAAQRQVPALLWVHLDVGDGTGMTWRALGTVRRLLESLALNYRFESSFVAVAGLAPTGDTTPVFLAVKFPGDARKQSNLATPALAPTDLLRVAPSLADALAPRGAKRDPGSLRATVTSGGP